MMSPQSMAIITSIFPPERRGAAFAVPGILGGLAVALRDEAIRRADQLPQQFRESFVDGFSGAGEGGLEVGTSQSGGGAPLPQQVQQLAEEVFESGFVDAMRPTLILPIAVVLLAAVSCLAVKQRKHKAQPEQQPEETAA